MCAVHDRPDPDPDLAALDLIVHTWDIEETLGPPADVPDDLVRWGLAELADGESLTARHFGLAGKPPERSVDDAAAYLGCFGR